MKVRFYHRLWWWSQKNWWWMLVVYFTIAQLPNFIDGLFYAQAIYQILYG